MCKISWESPRLAFWPGVRYHEGIQTTDGRHTVKKSIKKLLSKLLTWALILLLGMAAGYLGAALASRTGMAAGALLFLLIGLLAGFLIQIILHEGGHLVCGLATGYGFVSFRVGSLMLIRRDGRFQWCRYRLSGTGGQCLLSPPPWREEGFPAFAYNLGGPLANLVSVLLCGALVGLCRRSSPALACIWIGVGLAGLYLGLVNGIPLKISGMPNDGYNALHLGKDPVSRRAIWAQLAINAAQMEGKRLRDIPGDWFVLPGDAGPDDPLKGSVWVFRYSRLLDQGRYEEAAALRDELLKKGDKLAAVHQYALQTDRGFFDLLEGRTEQGLNILESPGIKAFCRQMKGNPGIVLVQYGAARAAGKTREADRLRAQLEKALEAWPYPGDAAATRDLLARAEERLGNTL